MKTCDSFALWPITPFGAEGEDGASDGDGSEGNRGGAGAEGKEDSKSGKGKPADGAGAGDDGDDDDLDEFKGLSAAELRRIAADNAKAAKDAEKARAAAQAKIDAEERKKNDDVTNLTNDLAEANKTIETLRATNTKMAIIGAIRDDDRFTFHDPEMVATVAGQIAGEDLIVTDDGKVEGLKAILPKVAKQHPFLVKETKSEKGDDKQDRSRNGGGQSNNGPTGFQPGQGGTSGGDGGEINRKALEENYPALAARI